MPWSGEWSGEYILDKNGNPVKADIETWLMWFAKADRRVEKTVIGGVTVSTVFLAIDHGFMNGVPVLWETMIFGGIYNGDMQRYTSLEEARAGHAAMVKMVKGSNPKRKYTRTRKQNKYRRIVL